MPIIADKEIRKKVKELLAQGKAVIIKRKGSAVKVTAKSPNVVVIEVEGEQG